jgi:predicted acyl esterase
MTNIWNRLQPHHRNIDFGRLNFSGKWFFLIIIIHCVWASTHAQNSQDSLWFRQNYTKKEVMIPMRDGIKLFTSIYIPKDLAEAHPIIMRRTPYSCYPYGQDEYAKLYDNYYNYYLRDNYIIVSQDVRGRFMSEGEFEDIRPIVANKRDNKDY